ncbi:MAG: hypothetical protein HN348_23660 [Proteobacteria bacterium]|nr:hypothetical protein [Pseudomonadota bacterium]
MPTKASNSKGTHHLVAKIEQDPGTIDGLIEGGICNKADKVGQLTLIVRHFGHPRLTSGGQEHH